MHRLGIVLVCCATTASVLAGPLRASVLRAPVPPWAPSPSVSSVPRQQAPATDVYLVPLKGGGPINVSNSPGYDNQPSFLPDSSAVLFSSNRDGKQTDIYRYDIASKALTQLTRTVDSEYSPLVTPDGKGFSVIRQAAADSTQLLVRYSLDGSDARVIFENVKPVGYHAWIDATHVAMFILGGQGQPATLQIGDTETGKAEVVATGIGRSILIRPKAGTVSFMTTGQNRMVKELDPRTRQIRDLFPPIGNGQDAAWTPDGRFFMASGTSVRHYDPAGNLSSVEMSFGPDAPGFNNITRLTVSPNGQWLAFVAEPGAAK